MIYTIGYEKLTPKALAVLAEGLKAVVTDCRAKPQSRRPGFNRRKLRALLGPSYEWWGDRLGGRPPGAKKDRVTQDGLRELKESSEYQNHLLLCVEEHPEDCHRHSLICAPHFPNAIHIYQDELFS